MKCVICGAEHVVTQYEVRNVKIELCNECKERIIHMLQNKQAPK